MIKLSSENSDMLKDLFKDKNCSPMINDLVSSVLGLKINKIEYECIKKFETISEYEFSLVKTKCYLEMEECVDIYFKVIKNDKIKESLFCYWCLLFEEKLKENKQDINMTTIINNVIISEVGMERYKNSVFLEIKDNTTGILENGTEVHFIDFIKYINNYKGDDNSLEKWNKYLDKENKDILMSGVVLNKDMGRSNIRIM